MIDGPPYLGGMNIQVPEMMRSGFFILFALAMAG